jgi:hypothetical protein
MDTGERIIYRKEWKIKDPYISKNFKYNAKQKQPYEINDTFNVYLIKVSGPFHLWFIVH